MSKNWTLRSSLSSKYGPLSRGAERSITHRAMLREVEGYRPFRPPWDHPPVDPRIEHIITIELEGLEPAASARMTCTCGIDRGWQSYIESTDDASTHCNRVEAAKAEQAVDDVPVAMIERRTLPSGTQEFRRFCPRHRPRPNLDVVCGKVPKMRRDKSWLPSEEVAVVSSIHHADQCRTQRPNRNAKEGSNV